MIICFWNYLHGRSNTSNCIASALNYSLNYKAKALILDSEYQKSLMANAFFNPERIKSLKTLEYGIDSISNILYSKQKIDKEDFDNFSTSIIEERLNFLPGSSKANRELYNNSLSATIPQILESARECYDMVFIDVNSGIDNEITKNILSNSDYIFISLEQNEKMLEDFFNTDLKYINDKKYGIMLGRYDPECKCSAKHIMKKFKYKGDIFTIPYNTNFLNSINSNNVVEFFYKNNIDVKKKSDIGFFNELDEISDALYEIADDKKTVKMPLGENSILTKVKYIVQS